MKAHKSDRPYNWRAEYRKPKSLLQARLRIVYGLRELIGGSVHRGLDVLIYGRTWIPGEVGAQAIEALPAKWHGLDLRHTPPQLPWKISQPDYIEHAEARIHRALDLIMEGNDLEAGIRALRHIVVKAKIAA